MGDDTLYQTLETPPPSPLVLVKKMPPGAIAFMQNLEKVNAHLQNSYISCENGSITEAVTHAMFARDRLHDLLWMEEKTRGRDARERSA